MEKRVRKHRLALMVMLGLAAIGLAGCGANAENAAKTSKVAFMKTAQNKQPQVWLQGSLSRDTVHKDDTFSVLVVQNGKETAYSKAQLTFKDIKGKSDAQVIKLAKTKQKSAFNKMVKDQKTYLKEALAAAQSSLKNQQSSVSDYKQEPIKNTDDDGSPANLKAAQAKIDQVKHNMALFNATKFTYAAPKAHKLSAYVNTDDNDKKVTAENINWQEDNPAFKTPDDTSAITNTNVSKLYQYKSENAMSYTFDENGLISESVSLLNEKYVGYYVTENGDTSSYDWFLITRTKNAKASAQFDTAKTPSIKKTSASLVSSDD
ncbi:hypothetical protein [Secundilactobacillus mixtipabuli]|uniref:Lipoprotein n=1 Tax=Secundilactobacillus mixtipabuli TaxID=1435342 RepID=A0A1Z5IA94_9LACO|nr:hypothetical protein [Secundilactobacillus mixtipabuli]GAW98537.1 hypothetical protein IWT30_00482 [Secundilactobacillus mixtipabuli]